MKPGTIVRLPDGREGTVVYHGLDGYGIKWGRHDVDEAKILETCGMFQGAPKYWPWLPEAMLRDPWPGADMECVGDDYEVVEALR